MATAHDAERKHPASGLLQAPNLPVVVLFAGMVVALAALLPLVQSSGATTTAGRISQLEGQKADWQARTRELETEIATMGSLDRIEKEATERLHMVPPVDAYYITVDVPPPEERRLPSRFLPPAQEREEGGSSLWEDLFGWIPLP